MEKETGCPSHGQSLRTEILDFGGLDSSRSFVLRGGTLMSIVNSPESLSQAILAGRFLVGGLGVRASTFPLPSLLLPASCEDARDSSIMYVCMYVCMYIYIYIHTYTHTYIHMIYVCIICIIIYVYIHIYIYIYTYTYVHT